MKKQQIFFMFFSSILLAGIYLFKINNGNTKAMCKICSKLIIKTPERGHWYRSVIFVLNFEQVFYWTLWTTLNPLFCCFHCWLWTSKYQVESWSQWRAGHQSFATTLKMFFIFRTFAIGKSTAIMLFSL